MDTELDLSSVPLPSEPLPHPVHMALMRPPPLPRIPPPSFAFSQMPHMHHTGAPLLGNAPVGFAPSSPPHTDPHMAGPGMPRMPPPPGMLPPHMMPPPHAMIPPPPGMMMRPQMPFHPGGMMGVPGMIPPPPGMMQQAPHNMMHMQQAHMQQAHMQAHMHHGGPPVSPAAPFIPPTHNIPSVHVPVTSTAQLEQQQQQQSQQQSGGM